MHQEGRGGLSFVGYFEPELESEALGEERNIGSLIG